MSNLTTRAGKGSPLTNNELDANFTNLNADKVEIGGDLSGTPTAPIVTKVQGQSFSSAAANVGEKLVWNGTAWAPATDPSGEPIGHADKSESSIGFNAGTRTFTISPVSASFVVWCKGVKHTYTSAQTVVIPNTTGLHFIYFNASGVLSTQMTYFTWEEHAPTAYIYWNATTQQAVYFGDERHGITLDWQTHEYLHRTRGAAIANGFGASGYTTTGAGATDADAQIDIGGGTFFDEDMQVDIVSTNTPVAGTWQQDLSGPALIPVLYLSGSSWVLDSPTNFPFKVVSGVPQYNLYSGGTWSTAPVSNNEYFVSWILATNNLTYPVIAIISQAPTNQLSGAEAMTFEGLNLNGFPSVEFRPLYKVIYQYKTGFTNSIKASTISVYDLRSLQSAGVAAALVQDHGNLSGLGDDDHAQYLHVSEVRTPSSAVKNSFLPSQTSNNGKYLTTDGINPSWGDVPSGSLTFTGDVTGTGNTGSSTTLTLANSGVTAGTFTKVTVDTKGRVTTGASATSSDIATALGFTPEDVANKAVANGYASLDGSGKVPSNQLPSYVDDVLEYANLAAFPATGETGKIYIAIDTVKTYRWSGSAYVEISASPGSTDAVPEGSTNLYFTNARARAAVGASGSLSYSTATGIFSYTQPTNVSAFTNDSGYLTGITGAQVTSALGYTPYNATNPAGYTTNVGTVYSVSGTGTVSGLTLTGSVTSSGSLTLGGTLSLTSGQVTTALGYTPPQPTGTGASGTWGISISGNAATVTNGLYKSGTNAIPAAITLNTTADNWMWQIATSGGNDWYWGPSTANFGVGANRLAFSSSGGSANSELILERGTTKLLEVLQANLQYKGNVVLHAGNYGSGYFKTINGSSIIGTGDLTVSGTDNTKLPLTGGTLTGNLVYTNVLASADQNYGLYGRNAYFDTVNGRGTDPLELNYYDGGPVKIGSGTNGSKSLYAVGIYDNGNQVLHAGNYNDYAPSKTGTGASGTWSINITGNAATTSQRNFTGDIASTGQGRFTGWYDGASGNNALATEVGVSGGASYILSYNRSTATYGTLSLNAANIQLVPQGGSLTGPGGNVILHVGNYSSYALPLTGGNLTGQTTLTAGHTNTRFQLRYDHDGNPNSGAAGYLTLWASEPGLTYAYTGIGGNVNIGGQHYGRQSTGQTYGVYIRWDTASGQTQFWNTTGTPGVAGGEGTLRAYVASDGEFYATANTHKVLHAGNYNDYAPKLDGTGANGTWGINITGSAASAPTAAKSSATTVPASTAFAKWMFATTSTSGTLDWNASSNTFPGVGETLLLGSAANGPGGGNYYHPFNIEYSGNEGNGQITQMAIAYGTPANELYMRGRYAGSWSSWVRYLNSSNYSSYALPLSGGTMTGHLALGDNRLYLRTNGDTNHYLWNAADDWEELVAYSGTGFRIISSASSFIATFSTGNTFLWSPLSTTDVINIGYNTAGSVATSARRGIDFHGADYNYWIGKRAAAWTQPLDVSFYTGIRYHAHSSYGGHRFYSTGYDSTEAFSVGNGDSNVRVINTLYSYAYRGNGNVAGTGEATYHPAGIYSTSTNWLYGTMYRNGSDTYSEGGSIYSTNQIVCSQNYGRGLNGVYDSYRFQHVWMMGTSYQLAVDGTTTGNAYGIAWSHPNAGGVAGNLDSHGMLILINGGFASSMSYSIRASGNVTAYSDERLKTNWREMPENYVERLAQVKVGIYDRIDGEKITQVGIGAQSFQRLLPEAITKATDEMGTLSVSYGNAAMASAVELAKELVMLKKELAEIKSRLH